MTVWILLHRLDYEGGSIVAVFATEDSAKRARKELIDQTPPYRKKDAAREYVIDAWAVQP